MKRNNFRLTDLAIEAIQLDKWNKMRVTLSKDFFSKKTLSKVIAHNSTLLDCDQGSDKIESGKSEERNGKCTIQNGHMYLSSTQMKNPTLHYL